MTIFKKTALALCVPTTFATVFSEIAFTQPPAPKPKLPACHTICTPTETLVTCDGWGDQALVVAQCAAPRKSFMEAYHHG